MARSILRVTEHTHRHEPDERKGSSALAASLQLQRSVQQRDSAKRSRRGHRRRDDVVDLNSRTLIRQKRHLLLWILLALEGTVAAVLVVIFVAVLVRG